MVEVREENPFLKMSPKERQRQRELLAYADAAEGAALDVAAAAALKWAYNRLKSREKLGEAFANLNVQAFPREANLGKAADLSETEIENIKQLTAKALEDVADKAAKATAVKPG